MLYTIVMSYTYKHAVLGGTFDHLHAGHKRILDFAFHVAQKVTIGIVEQAIQEKKFQETIESYRFRHDGVSTYIAQNKWSHRSSIVALTDIYGPATKDATIDALIATEATIKNAKKVAAARTAQKLPPINIVTIPFYKDETNIPLSSTRIREGIVTRTGKSYVDIITKNKQLDLPPRLRDLMRKPLGIIIQGELRFASLTASKALQKIQRKKPLLTIAIGDIVSKTLLSAGLVLDVSVIDYKTRRKKLNTIRKVPTGRVLNPPSTLRLEAIKGLNKAINNSLTSKKTQTLRIKGEEDLLALPAILLAPLDSMVIYGQSDLGIILVPVTEKMKHKAAAILSQFE